MKLILSILLAILTVLAVIAQVPFQQYNTPVGADENYRLVVDYYTNQQLLFPVNSTDTVYYKSATGSFMMVDEGLYITAFFADNGDLYFAVNTNPSGYAPKLYKTPSGGGAPTEITGVSGRIFSRDQHGNLFYSVPNGFRFSTDNGASFTSATVSDSLFAVARAANGDLFYMTDGGSLYQSTDNGASWQDVSKTGANSSFNEHILYVMGDTVFFQSGSSAYYATAASNQWTSMFFNPISSIFTYLHVSPDLALFGYGAYGFSSANQPITNSWTLLATNIGSGSQNIYNHYVAVTDSQMYFYTSDSGYLYTGRTPNAVGVHGLTKSTKSVAVYPNPAHGFFTITSTETVGELYLFNLQGQVVLSEPITRPAQQINISQLPSGLYIWQMGDYFGKLLVE